MRFSIGDPAVIVDGNCADGLYLAAWQLTRAAPRVVMRDRPGFDGVIDLTARSGGSILQIAAQGSDASELLRFDAAGRVGQHVHITIEGSRKWPAVVAEAVGYGVEVDSSFAIHSVGEAITIAEWSIPGGVFHAVETLASPVTLLPGSGVGGSGIVLPEALPWAMTPAPVIGSGVVSSQGTAPTMPTMQFFGPAVQPSVSSSQGGTLTITRSIPADQLIEVDFAARTAQLNGVAGAAYSAHADLDWDGPIWWPIMPGDQEMRMAASSFGDGARVVVEWADAFI